MTSTRQVPRQPASESAQNASSRTPALSGSPAALAGGGAGAGGEPALSSGAQRARRTGISRAPDRPFGSTLVTPDQDAIVSEIHIAAPADRVFEALTDSAQLMRWFTSPECPVKFWKMDARPGGRYSYATEKGTIVVNNVSEFECHGEILECVPPRLLVYTWIANWHDDKSLATVVRWDLIPQAGGTLVKVTHSGLAQEAVARKDYAGGWPGAVEALKKFVEQ